MRVIKNKKFKKKLIQTLNALVYLKKLTMQKYQKLTDIDHVLKKPDMYLGPVDAAEATHWILRDERMVESTGPFIAGLFKMGDEALVNARDHVLRMAGVQPVTYIDVTLIDGVFTIENDGAGIDVEMHPDHKVYVPELIFAHLRTSTNYDDTEKRIVGGKNGYGIKLAFIWSSTGSVETVDSTRQLKYTQSFHNNLSVIEPPVIKACKKKSYTRISFKPDYVRFNLPGLSEFHFEVFKRRVYDLAAVTSVKVSFNGVAVPVKTFSHYVDLYLGPKTGTKRVSESWERWEYAVAASDHFTHVSFVNGIHTAKGGKHVDYVVGQIVRKVVAHIKLKKKVDVKPGVLREHLSVFLQCTIENPSFDSQTKDCMTSPVSSFGSSCEVSDKFCEKVAALVLDDVLAITQAKETQQAKKHDGAKTRTIRGIPKLVDANYAGTAKSGQCTLILCEGDSAKAGVVSGLSREDRNIFGVYPMRGKTLNVRDQPLKKVTENKEIHELMQVLGLEFGKVYGPEEVKTKLRYGHVLFMTDQDLDGHHIKGLGINVFDSLWRSLAQHPDFLGYMNTPIIKARKGTKEELFYSDAQFQAWRESNDTSKWTIKYYKGLGTSTASEFKEYFKTKKMVHYAWEDESADVIDMAFNPKRADNRKEWLKAYDRKMSLDTTRDLVSYQEFVNVDLRSFSTYDNERSLGSVVDGMKPSQRKVLYSAFKKNLKGEIKVAQFSGYVSEHAAYHHGEQSLNGTIVGMAQNFMGSNNINLFEPLGQFGTRLQGGKDSASERYIFTKLNPIARKLFPSEDDAVLEYRDDDGFTVEPEYYVPILPMILVNGCKGIGTGFSTDIPSFNPQQLQRYLEARLKGKPFHESFVPFYRGFKGTIEPMGEKFLCRGVFSVSDVKVHVTELPVGTWTDDYKEFLEGLMGTVVKEYTDHSTDTVVDLVIKLVAPIEDVEKTLKLTTTRSLSNMHLFDASGKLKKYASIESILDDYYDVRLKTYDLRKAALLKAWTASLLKISNKVRYIRGVLDDSLDLRKKSSADIQDMLRTAGLDELDGSYSYLIKMPMDSVSEENVQALKDEKRKMKDMVDELGATSAEKLWLNELAAL
jgi:DNA topoisomerase-2